MLLGAALIGLLIGALVAVLAARTQSAAYKKQIAALTAQVASVSAREAQKQQEPDETEETALDEGTTAAPVSAARQLSGTDPAFALTLICPGHELDASYSPKLTDIGGGFRMDERAAGSMKEMLAAAEKAGLHVAIISAYRSYDEQKQVFSSTMQDWNAKGYSLYDSYEETKKSVAVPGTSEHASGLAADITSASYTGLDDRQAQTAEAKWLMEHCWEYGYILRYPPDKSDITGIVYEPWHYRYVGRDAAKEIHEKGVTLEEYLKEKQTGESVGK